MNKRIVIVGNGILSKKDFALIENEDYVIGVDRAAYWLIRKGRAPDIAIGDFDSVSVEEFTVIQQSVRNIQQHPKEKDQTDMELGVRFAIQKNPVSVLILGGIGNRIDHTIGTLCLLDLLLSAKIPHILVNECNRVQLVGKGRTILHYGKRYRYVSILPFTKDITLSLSGFRYDSLKIKLFCGTTHSISNEIVGRQAAIELYSGKAWVVESKD